MNPKIMALSLLSFFFLSSMAESSAQASLPKSHKCLQSLQKPELANTNIDLGFFEPSISSIWNSMPERDQAAAKTHLLESAGYAVEPVPFVMPTKTWNFLEEASLQRARAANAFLEDVYRHKKPHFLMAHPEMAKILNSSAAFIDELVETEAIKSVPFDFTIAMDAVLVKNERGHSQFRILESDTGAIGGNMRLAQIAHGLYEVWPQLAQNPKFQDGRRYLFERMKRATQHAEIQSGQKNPVVLMFTEEDPGFAPGKDTVIQKWFRENGITTASSWSKNKISFDPKAGVYTIDGKPIAHVWLEYYQGQFDPTLPSFLKLPKDLQEDPYELGHAIPGFWQNWMARGHKNWSQWNLIGAELFCDKAISAYLPEMIRTYLHEEPLIDGHNYEIFEGTSLAETKANIETVFAQQDQFVVKYRAPVGGGAQVYIGRFMKDGKKNNLTWQDLKKEVEKNPLDWVFQEFMAEEALVLPDGRKRSFELRTIVNVDGGHAYAVNGVYIRSASIGSGRNLTGSREQSDPASIIPVLLPQ